MTKLRVFLLLALLAPSQIQAQKIAFVEQFALAPDRTKALAQLIPGTEDYYFYHCLHHQNLQQYDRVEELLAVWIKRFKYTTRVRQVLNRQALLTYGENPQKSLEYLIQQLRFQYAHQRATLDGKSNLPSRLDPQLISRERLYASALARYKTLRDFEDSAFDWLMARPLDATRRRDLLQRMRWPDHEKLVSLVIAELNTRGAAAFGSLEIHRRLLLSQLNECLKLKPELLNQSNFVQIYLSKLRPGDDVDWRNDAAQELAYYERLWSFVSRLGPVHNSLKAHVLYHRLQFDRARGVYDKQRFMQYIRLPRRAVYVNPKYLQRVELRNYLAQLGANYQKVSMLPIVGNDEPLVRRYFHHFFVKENDYTPYQQFILDSYLKRRLAEAKIVNGLGDPERWYSMLSPAEYQQLQQRVDLDFAPTNKSTFAIGDAVELDVHVKNVKKLIVKVYEVNTRKYYQDTMKEVDTNINLDGLVANHERSLEYTDAPVRRIQRRFKFPELNRAGIYVIDLIGNGKSSRALVRIGRLQYVVRDSTAGHVFRVLDAQANHLKTATIWMGNKEYRPDKEGFVTLPYSSKSARQPIILSHGDQHTLTLFGLHAEQYILNGGFFVDRESLIEREIAKLVIRPALRLNGNPVTLSVLEDVQLTITSVDREGIQTTKQVKDFKLFEDRESTYEFQVPPRLATIAFRLTAKVQNLSQNKKIDLQANRLFGVNGIVATDKVEDLHLSRIGGSYIIQLLGRNGEPRPSRQIRVMLKHRDFRQAAIANLQTDAKGRVHLGQLPDITAITATGPENTTHRWATDRDKHTHRSAIHGSVGEQLQVPLIGVGKLSRAEVSLLALRDNVFVSDQYSHLKLEDGLLRIQGLSPGDYDLFLKRAGRVIRLRIGEGKTIGNHLIGPYRQLELRGGKPLQIAEVQDKGDRLTIRLVNSSEVARVHVISTRMMPEISAYDELAGIGDVTPGMSLLAGWRSLYAAGRNIGDEYRYIIDRRYAAKFPGNMLERPQILLNPWAIRKTQTGTAVAASGDDFARKVPPRDAANKARGRGGRKQAAAGGFANLDFFFKPSAVLLNLTADKKGMITIPRAALGDGQHIHIVAVDPRDTVIRTISMAERPYSRRELRLVAGLDPKLKFTQQKQIAVLNTNQSLRIDDISSARFEIYDSLPKVFRLYTALSNNSQLQEFAFLIRWPDLKDAEKRELYSKHACHELHFFLYHKDRKFFDAVVAPYLANKRDKTFLDQWLLAADVSDRAAPWSYRRLNTVEKIVFSRRLENEQTKTARFIREQVELTPPNVNLFNRLFSTAVKSSDLDAEGEDGVAHLKRNLKGMRKLSAATKKPAAARRPGGFAGKAMDAPAEEAEKMMDKLAESRKEEGKKANSFFERDRLRRKSTRQLYRKLDATQEWVENNYYKLPIESQVAALVKANKFWQDYAEGPVEPQPFRSGEFAQASNNFTEMMMALAVLDLPFAAEKHKMSFDKKQMTLVAASPLIAFHEQLRPAAAVGGQTSILVSQNFYDAQARYRTVNAEKVDNFVTEEFLMHAVYGCQVVVTNPTSARQKLNVLLQIPRGAIALRGGKQTRSVYVDLQPYRTQTIDYYFYFPEPGQFDHYPVHVARDEKVLASAKPFRFNVVPKLSKIDRTAWAYVSQFATDEEVIKFLEDNNLQRIQLNRMAFRMKDKAFFRRAIRLLEDRHIFDYTLWSYALKHNHAAAIRQLLKHSNAFVANCGALIDSPLLTIDPVERHAYQHMEYRPLVNAHRHQLGRERQILNDRFHAQYHRLMNLLSYRRELDDRDNLAVVYYLLLQDRVAEAIERFGKINADRLGSRIQYDYLSAYMDFFTDQPRRARQIAERYRKYPVDRWREAFLAILNQLDEIAGAKAKVADQENRDQVQAKLAATESSFDFVVESNKIRLNYQNVAKARFNYYLMDIELLFSRNPFVQQFSGQFSHIRPNLTRSVTLPKDKNQAVFDLPKQLDTRNVLVEVVADGRRKTQAYYSNSLTVQVLENYGQVRVSLKGGKRGKSKVYVKVYARMKNGTIRFYKDGYTDIRGRFDYTSLSTNELDQVGKFSILILSEKHGAVVREASPPKR